MEYKLRIEADGGVAVRTVNGELSADAVLAARHELITHPDYRPGMNELWDLSEATLSNLSATELSNLINRIQTDSDAYSGHYKVAVVVPQDFGYGVARQFQALSDEAVSFALVPFRRADEAWEWLRPGRIER